ncbi:ABC transporter ATP-binding protein [Hwanghaeella grinnelliae]|uniref:ABC transporter ATP-binding protein n=1 Tax=Hwanghaeella grinnelliae TaxID=2500179 RepID=A0A437QQQ1_9PROT|nr:ABC transporter ATP-binding protein [Hwanghaeella grinnelliae]
MYLLFLNLVAVVVEGLGLAMMLPIFEFLQSNGDLQTLTEKGVHWKYILEVAGALGVPVSLESLLAFTLIMIITRQAILYARQVTVSAARMALQKSLQDEVFRRYLHTSLEFQKSHSTGTVVNDIVGEIGKATRAIVDLLTIIGILVVGAVYVTAMLVISWQMTLSALCVFGVIVFSVQGLMRRSREIGQQIVDINQSITHFLVQRLSSTRLIRLSRTEQAEIDRFCSYTTVNADRAVSLQRSKAIIDIVPEPILAITAAATIIFGEALFGLTITTLSVFLVIALRLLPTVKQAQSVRQNILANHGSIEVAVNSLTSLKAKEESASGNRTFGSLDREIRFESVSFSYGSDEDKRVLDHLDLTIPAGKLVAIVGPSGAGKSTLIDMLPRLRIPDSGVIRFDGVDISEFNLHSLRNGIAYAQQSPEIFDGTIADHIRYGRSDMPDADVLKAAKLAGLGDFLDGLPEGLNTYVGEKGGSLSGGQKQRLEIARAILGGVPILILDEPTSQLDALSERDFCTLMTRLARETNMTIIMVAHRISTIQITDEIIVMLNGKVVDTGVHSELIDKNGWYRTAFGSPPALHAADGGVESAETAAQTV